MHILTPTPIPTPTPALLQTSFYYMTLLSDTLLHLSYISSGLSKLSSLILVLQSPQGVCCVKSVVAGRSVCVVAGRKRDSQATKRTKTIFVCVCGAFGEDLTRERPRELSLSAVDQRALGSTLTCTCPRQST